MKIIFWMSLLASFLLIGCSAEKAQSPESDSAEIFLEVPNITTVKSTLHYDHQISLWLLNGQPYSGFAVSYYPDSTLMERIGILDGKKQNEAIKWYPDGHFKNVSNYHQGKQHGEKKIWANDSTHVLIAHYNFRKGKAHGEQKKWYPTGELFNVLNLNMGKEEGLQKAFRKNGALYANYEAREGRIFGLKKAALCYGLEDETVRTKKE
ncbi:toxin-antitoxin system YwqK family antitoxin [Ekhidna sp.]